MHTRRRGRQARRQVPRKRHRQESDEPEPPQPTAVDRDAWHTPDFRRRVLVDLAFVSLPAVLMALLGEHTYAALWFTAGVLIIIYQFRRQLRDFWRSLRTGRH